MSCYPSTGDVRNRSSEFLDQVKNPSFIRYLLLCVIGSSICYLLYTLFPAYPFQWSIISVLIVLAPEKKDARKLALDRIKANVIGSVTGLLSFLIHTPDIMSLGCSVVATVLICTWVKLGNASRSALAALAIVLILEKERNTFDAALERMGCVIAGCIVALIITSVFQSHRWKHKRGKYKLQQFFYNLLS